MFISSLPDKLSDEEFDECMKKYKETGSEEERERLINHNLRLVAYVVLSEFEYSRLERDDMFSYGVMGLIKAVDNFDISKGYAFATFATRCIKNEILMFYRREKKRLNNYSIQDLVHNKEGRETDYTDFFADESIEFEENIADHDVFLYLCDEIENLNERDREIVKLFFGIGREQINQFAIAEKFDLSQSCVSRIIKKCITTMKNKLMIEMSNNYSLLRRK